MFDPNELNAKIAQSHISTEKAEEEAKGLEAKILENYEVNRSMLPKRNFGQPVDPSKFSMHLKHFIEKNQPEVASYLGFNTVIILDKKKSSKLEPKLKLEWKSKLKNLENKMLKLEK